MEPVFNVINFNASTRKFEEYDIIPYLLDKYYNLESKPRTEEEFKRFIDRESMYMWWSRCEYEILLIDWPNKGYEEKWDVYRQIIMNLDLITKLFIEIVKDKFE